MPSQERSPPGERRASKSALASNSDNTAKSKPLAQGFQAPATEIIAELRFRRHVERLHGLGAHVTAGLLAELGSERGIQTIIDQKVRRFAAIGPQHLTALGGDDFPPVPLHVVMP